MKSGFIRQGEWFFIPRPDFAPANEQLIHRNEPIRRGGGKPHLVEELCRRGGTRVYVCRQHPNGLTEDEYRDLLRQQPHATGYNWRIMQRDAEVFARGRIRHPDHQTVILRCWHQVLMNTERVAQNVAFLD